MHRRDYVVIAKALREAKKTADKQGDLELSVISYTIDEICKALKAENSSFNETKFRSYIEKGE